MGIVGRISNAMGMPSIDTRIEILDNSIFHGEKFGIRIHLHAGEKKVTVRRITASLVWKEDLTREIVSATKNILSDKHILERKRIDQSLDFDPGDSKSITLKFSTKELPRYHILDRFHIKIQIRLVGSPSVTVEIPIEIFPERTIAAPLVAMLNVLNFSMTDPDPQDPRTYAKYRWILQPPPDTYEHIHLVTLYSFDIENMRDHIYLEIDLWENCRNNMLNGIHEVNSVDLAFDTDDVTDEKDEVEQELIANQIRLELSEAERSFKKILKMDGKWGLAPSKKS